MGTERSVKVPTRRLNRRWVQVAVMAGAWVLALLLVELTFRVAGIGSDQFLRSDSVLGVRFIASKRGLSQGVCFQAHVSINAHGWRNSELSVSKPSGVYRVLVLGDSYMAGLQVEDDETFSSVLESRLNLEELSHRVEVINFGVPSFGTDQEFLALREYGMRLAPDLVILAFYAQNDVRNNYAVLESSGNEHAKPFFDIEDGNLVELPFDDTTPAVIAAVRRVGASFRVYSSFRDSLLRIPVAHQLLYKLGIVGIVPQPALPAEPQGSIVWRWPGRWPRQTEVYRRDYPVELSHAWSITERVIVEIRNEAQTGGADFLLVGIADPLAVLPEVLLRQMVPGDTANPLERDKPTRRLQRLSLENGSDFVSLVHAFRARIGETERELERYYLRCDGHWTAAGHRFAADVVAPDVAARIAELSR